jgi:hypothetical protein
MSLWCGAFAVLPSAQAPQARRAYRNINVQKPPVRHLEGQPHLGPGLDILKEALFLMRVNVDGKASHRAHAAQANAGHRHRHRHRRHPAPHFS